MPSLSSLSARCTVFAALFLSALPLNAQDLEISISPTPIGAGARAAGMADAFVAIADDATAASWNPAGLVQLEAPELSIVGGWNSVVDYFDAASFHPEVDCMHDVHNLDLNYLSFVYPLPFVVLDRNVTVSLNYQQKYDFTRKFTAQRNQHLPFGGGTSVWSLYERLDFEQSGGLSTVSPALAFELTHRLSVGASLNLWRTTPFSDNSWTQHTRDKVTSYLLGNTILATKGTREDYEDFRGENLTLGLLWDVNDRWKVGVRYDTAFTGEVDYERRGRTYRSNVTPRFQNLNLREKRHVRFPDSLALGVAYRANDRLTLSLDVTRTDWNDFFVRDGRGVRNSLVDGSNVDDRDESTDMDPTYTVRLGAEYVFVPRQPAEKLNTLWTLRGGVFYDEEPATGKRGANEEGDGNADPFYGVALGFGVQILQRVNIDAAYQYRFGRGVNADFLRGVPGFEEDIDQHRLLLSTVIYFK
jgi:long-subunit fatty acid transport protein